MMICRRVHKSNHEYKQMNTKAKCLSLFQQLRASASMSVSTLLNRLTFPKTRTTTKLIRRMQKRYTTHHNTTQHDTQSDADLCTFPAPLLSSCTTPATLCLGRRFRFSSLLRFFLLRLLLGIILFTLAFQIFFIEARLTIRAIILILVRFISSSALLGATFGRLFRRLFCWRALWSGSSAL